jgi:diamine N-acetyltransferase
MIIQTKDNRNVLLQKLTANDFEELSDFLLNLSQKSKKRFGPHSFDGKSIAEVYSDSARFKGYIARDAETLAIIAYSILKIGFLEHDSLRLRSYGLTLDSKTDCTFAPSVADSWQGIGIGNSLFSFIIADLKAIGIKRIILWGGVQCTNTRAVNYYLKNGFTTLGQFEYNGLNYDMICDIK